MDSRGYFPKNSLPVKIVEIDDQCFVKMHSHDFHELVIVTGGYGVHYTEFGQYKIECGDVFLVKPGYHHSYGNTDNMSICNLLYQPERMNLPLFDIADVPGYYAFFEVEPAMRKQHGFKSRLRLSNNKLDYLKGMIRVIDMELEKRDKGVLHAVFTSFMQIVLLLSRSYTKTDTPAHEGIVKLGEILSYIESNSASDITLSMLARKASISETSLYRMFKKAFGESPVNYVITVRLNRAKEMLKNSSKSISSIAWDTGFHDSNYFSRTFKKHTGISPRQFRKQLQFDNR